MDIGSHGSQPWGHGKTRQFPRWRGRDQLSLDTVRGSRRPPKPLSTPCFHWHTALYSYRLYKGNTYICYNFRPGWPFLCTAILILWRTIYPVGSMRNPPVFMLENPWTTITLNRLYLSTMFTYLEDIRRNCKATCCDVEWRNYDSGENISPASLCTFTVSPPSQSGIGISVLWSVWAFLLVFQPTVSVA